MPEKTKLPSGSEFCIRMPSLAAQQKFADVVEALEQEGDLSTAASLRAAVDLRVNRIQLYTGMDEESVLNLTGEDLQFLESAIKQFETGVAESVAPLSVTSDAESSSE